MGIHARRDRAGWGWVPRDNFDCRGGGHKLPGTSHVLILKKKPWDSEGKGVVQRHIFEGGGVVCLTSTRKSINFTLPLFGRSLRISYCWKHRENFISLICGKLRYSNFIHNCVVSGCIAEWFLHHPPPLFKIIWMAHYIKKQQQIFHIKWNWYNV